MAQTTIAGGGVFTAQNVADINANDTELYASAAAGVTLTGTQTLTNKTLTAPTITAPTITGTSTIGNGMTITTPVLSGTVTGTYTLGGTPTLASAAGVPYVGGVAAGYKLARVSMALDGSNPTSWATGLTTIVAAGVSLVGTAAPGVGTSVLTSNINGTSLDVYAWKVTATGDCTLIASTGTETFTGWAVGT